MASITTTIDQNTKPHVVCIPYPAQGHITPMTNLAKLLHSKNFHVTFVNTEYNHNRLIKSRGLAAVAGTPSFRFETIPDGLDNGDSDVTQDIPSLCIATQTKCLTPFRKLLCELNETGPKVDCIVSDGAMTFTLEAARELGIPDVVFWTTSVCGFLAYAHYQKLIDEGFVPLKDADQLTNGYLNTTIDCIPGMKGIKLKDIPSFIRTTDQNDKMLKFLITEIERAHYASAIIFNSFNELEQEAIDALSTVMEPPIYTLGPLHRIVNQMNQDHGLNLIGSNLWKEEAECIKWLDSKEPNSVLYVNFGSITVMTAQQLIEFAWGLCNSNKTFLWIIRPDLVTGESAVLGPEFLDQTKDRSLLATWCAQDKVLAHPSIACFLTHSGWNSNLESLSNGVPMICWPFFAEQQTNCYYSCEKWGVGLEIDSDVKRNEVENLVREVMENEKGRDMKLKAMEWKSIVEDVTASPNGLSLMNLDKLIDQVMLASKIDLKFGRYC